MSGIRREKIFDRVEEKNVGMCDWHLSFIFWGRPTCSALNDKDRIPKEKPKDSKGCRYYGQMDSGMPCEGACSLNDYDGRKLKRIVLR